MMATHQSVIIPHPNYKRGKAALARAMKTEEPGQLIYVIGLSGVGKSEIRYATMKSFAGPPSNWRQGEIPVIAVRATPSDRSNFNPKEFASRMYLELHEPNVEWLRRRSTVGDPDQVHRRAEERLNSPLWSDVRIKLAEHELRGAFERSARARGLRALFVEEAASLTYTYQNKNPVDHMVNYMCLAEEIGITLVLFGVPRIAALWEGNAEVLRRSRFVWIDRYRFDRSEDRISFARLAVSIASRYSFSHSNLVCRSLDLAYASSAGVFGELVAYFRRADDLRADEDVSAICKRHLEGAVSTEAVLKTLHDDAAVFDMLRTPTSPAAIRRMLGK